MAWSGYMLRKMKAIVYALAIFMSLTIVYRHATQLNQTASNGDGKVNLQKSTDQADEMQLQKFLSEFDQVSPSNLIAFISAKLQREVAARKVRWIPYEGANQSLELPTQFESIGFYDHAVHKFKFFTTGWPETRDINCRIFKLDRKLLQVSVEVYKATAIYTDDGLLLQRKNGGGVVQCEKLLGSYTFNVSQLPSKQSLSNESVQTIGLLAYNNDLVPSYKSLTAELMRQCDNKRMALLLSRPLRNLSNAVPSVLVCVKAIYGNVNVRFLVEWLEYLRVFKADRVVLTVYADGLDAVSASALAVLRYYESVGVVHLWTMKAGVFRVNGSLGYTLGSLLHTGSLNLCLDYYRHEFQYVAVYDIDEIWVPLQNQSYGAQLRQLELQYGGVKGFTMTNWLFFSELPPESNRTDGAVSQRYFYRAQATHVGLKSVTPTEHCFIAHYHSCKHKYFGAPAERLVSVKDSVFHHYTYCWKHRNEDECRMALNMSLAVRDETLKPYANVIKLAVESTMTALNLDS